jgi:phytoene synthase
LYAFCREVDDVVDEVHDEDVAQPSSPGGGRRSRRRSAGRRSIRSRRRSCPVVREFALPEEHFQTIIDGMAMDLVHTRYLDFAALELYCHRVAGVVGLLSAEIFGYTNPSTRGYARDLGVAFQLTNICRDVGEDARRGRIYLPQETSRGSASPPSSILRANTRPRSPSLMEVRVRSRAEWYAKAIAQLPARIARRSARASSWRRSTARCSTRSRATATACSTARRR